MRTQLEIELLEIITEYRNQGYSDEYIYGSIKKVLEGAYDKRTTGGV